MAESDANMMKNYSIWLKVNGLLFMGISVVAYGVKFGLVWHDAGKPLVLSDLKFHPYYNMILTIYTVLGFYVFQASADPAKFKPLLSFLMYGSQLAHGIIATLAVFAHFEPTYVGPSIFGVIPAEMFGLTNWDKLFVACPFWLVLFGINLYFAKAALGSPLLPWQVGVPAMDGSQPSAHSYWLKVNGLLFMGISVVAYGFKFGLVWHDAGKPLVLSDLKFHPYYSMILVIYTVLGFYIFQASSNPAENKALLSLVMYTYELAHGVIATIAVFNHFEPTYVGSSIFGDIPEEMFGLTNWDKLFVACPFWFLLFGVNLFFAKKSFGSLLLPWQLLDSVAYTKVGAGGA
mmetsp:Transcript_54752/g.123289  ORF Transcript_54752/g.123289 Transcript_54752/m.123289 type:complete len:346 (+) Transcript_54752:66-1103(+)